MIASPGKVGRPRYRLSPQLMSWEAREREPQTLETKNQCVWDEGEGLRGAEWRGQDRGRLSSCHPHGPSSTVPWGSTLPCSPVRELRPSWWESREVATPDSGCPPWGGGGAGQGKEPLCSSSTCVYTFGVFL